MQNKKKIFNDPVYGFISIPDDLHFDIIEHQYFQRLRRIKQLGLSHFVYPGALHTRFHHSLGAMHLMQQAVQVLRSKGKSITKEEGKAVSLAILMHDIGHGPYSHTLEQSIVKGVSHEKLSMLIMRHLNIEHNYLLEEAIEIFCERHPKKFLSSLVSSQLDMDRVDYLKRDSFFTGVSEGTINAERLITMLDVVDNELVIEAKGIYSVENFIVARRLMYWQVYLHKTSVAAEKMLVNILKRAKELASQGIELFATPALHYFLYQKVELNDFSDEGKAFENFIMLDDSDFISAIKVWSGHSDFVLSLLCKSFINRRLFKVEVRMEPTEDEFQQNKIKLYMQRFNITANEAKYFMGDEIVSTDTYSPEDDNIKILMKDGSIRDIAEASDMLNIQVLTKKVQKHYFCYYKI